MMLFLYPLSLFYIAFTLFLLSFEFASYRMKDYQVLSFQFRKNERVRKTIFISGIAIASLSLFFPVYPGPIVLGDLAVSLSVLFSSFYIRSLGNERKEIIEIDLKKNKYFKYFVALSSVFIIHLLFPYLILF